MSGIRQNLRKILIGLVFFSLLAVVAAPASHAAASRATAVQPPRQGLADLIRKPTKAGTNTNCQPTRRVAPPAVVGRAAALT